MLSTFSSELIICNLQSEKLLMQVTHGLHLEFSEAVLVPSLPFSVRPRSRQR
jgi:hypothetical protein